MLERLRLHLAPLASSPRFCVAYSGGLDSHVLLHTLVQLLTTTQLFAIHVNHGWCLEAEDWAEHCRMICQQLGVAYQLQRVEAKAKRGESPEASARRARYAALTQLLQTGDCLLTAHHQDDQAETLLIQLFRGAGLKGLASMPIARWDGRVHHLRPLLTSTRAELLAYAQYYQLSWIEDSSNLDLGFDRNFIRHVLLPPVRHRWPEVSRTIARAATHCAEAGSLLDCMAQSDCVSLQGVAPDTLSIPRLKALPAERRRNVLRYWLRQLKLTLPTRRQLQQIECAILVSKPDACPKVCWPGAEIRRYQDDLYALPPSAHPALPHCVNWDLSQTLFLPAVGKLSAKKTLGQGIRCSVLATNKVVLRFRQGGERFHPAGRTGSRSLKKLFQEWAIPVWQRSYIPLVYYQDQLLAVVGYGVTCCVAATKDELGFSLEKEVY